ncbi:unnamed protein product [Gongylonema pulchrum]|uniref:Tudor domain-containing protein n=1 Tax=Gongylonema pulchrum TaxID=637853 RepID=A0A183E3F0_9BILA|nr:unnamed protein product [Gongylonema pulchrum]
MTVSASADLISLFLLMKMDKDCDRNSLLLVFTDACMYTPQRTLFSVVSVETECFSGDSDAKEIEPLLPYSISDYDSLETYAKRLAQDLFDTPVYTLKCGSLEGYFNLHRAVVSKAYASVDDVCRFISQLLATHCGFQVHPAVVQDEWSKTITVVGFMPANVLANVPSPRHYFIVIPELSFLSAAAGKSELLCMLCEGLRAEEYVAICRIKNNLYGALYALRYNFANEPLHEASLSFAEITKIGMSAVDDANEGPLFCVQNDSLSRPSYSSVQRTCWSDAHGLQSDFQKIVRN